MPTNTDLVKDLPADFEIFGQAVDTQMKTNADAAIAKTIIDAKGDLIVGSAADTAARLAVGGTNGHVLTVNSGATNGVEWAAVSGGGITSLASGSLSGTSVNLTSISGSYQNLRLIVRKVYFGSNANLRFKVNTTGNNSQFKRHYGGAGGSTTTTAAAETSATTIDANENAYINDSGNVHTTILDIDDYTSTTNKLYRLRSWYRISGGSDARQGFILDGAVITSSAVTEIEIIGTSTFSGGTYELFGIK